jgi:hypothetical protein
MASNTCLQQPSSFELCLLNKTGFAIDMANYLFIDLYDLGPHD